MHGVVRYARGVMITLVLLLNVVDKAAHVIIFGWLLWLLWLCLGPKTSIFMLVNFNPVRTTPIFFRDKVLGNSEGYVFHY